MNLFELLVIAFSLSMDAFAIAICKGLSVAKIKAKHIVSVGVWFGGAQAIMPLIGFLLASTFADYVKQFDHWIAFILLVIIGIGMIKEAREETQELNDSFSFKSMLPLALAGSIDALATGAAFAFEGVSAAFSFSEVNIYIAVTAIGVATFVFSAFGIVIGNKFGKKYRSAAELVGGIVLILLGAKTLISGLMEGAANG